MSSHPIQPLIVDNRSVIRYKANAIVAYLLHNGNLTMADIAREDFTDEFVTGRVRRSTPL